MESKINILILEDVWEDAYLIEKSLKKEHISFDSLLVETREDFVEGIKQFAPDIILSDHSLPQFDSEGALQISQKFCPETPFILVTGTVSEEFAVTILKKGASDYVLKDHLTRLGPAVLQALEQKKLREQKKAAEQALYRQNEELIKINAELDQFVYSASHDLRSPITGLIGLLGLAKKHEHDLDLLREYHQKMQFSINRLDIILSEILDYSYNARQDIRLETIDIKSLINKCLRNLKHLPEYKKVEPRVTIKESVQLISDQHRLSVMLSSLIKNAIQFYDSSKHSSFFRIDVSVSDSVVITLEDNGIGIKSSVLPNVYKMFYRGSSQSQGAGLGLYITQEIVTKLGGEINITSVQDQGTLVKVVLPLLQPTDGPDRSLFTPEVIGKLISQYDKAGYLKGQDVVCKIFKPNSMDTWYCINMNPADMESIWCIAVIEEAGRRQVKVCSTLRNELESFTLPFLGLHIERDRHFKPINAQEAYEKLLSGEVV
ncbi:MAG: ATP-binding protein [Cyclobacteriaceae bacterium]